MGKEQKIQAIMDTDLQGILEQTGQYIDFINGNILCSNCGKEINVENISSIVPYEECGVIKLKFYCDNIECINCEG